MMRFSSRNQFITSVGLSFLASAALAQGRGRTGPATVAIPPITAPATPSSVRALLSVIAADSMEGRAVWSKGSDRAAKFIAEQMRKVGLVPAGDSGYFQRIPGALGTDGRIRRLPSFADLDTVPVERRRLAVNVVGILPGRRPAADLPAKADSTILVDAHYDHLGMGRPVNGDSIFNGADDDASGTVAVLEIARIMNDWPAPGRTVVFLATTGEESGLVGTGWYLANPVRPLSAMAANLEIEMIGRPDTIATGRGRGWLTGFERSTMGETFQRSGLPIMADMRPSQSFFTRSDNIAFAQAGIPAHTLSSFNLHTDYHGVGDEVSKIDFGHMAALINTGARAVWVLTEGPAPTWNRGGRPCPAVPRPPQPQLTQAQQDSLRIAAQFPQSCGR
jgi:Peptidase family M28